MNKVIFIIGVSGCGKSTIGKMLASKMGCQFLDGDDFHPASNILKMKSGQALNDRDRKEWLEKLNKLAREQVQSDSVVLACSALKESYRDILGKDLNDHCHWIYLQGDMETIASRIAGRKGHFMPSSLLQSQFDILQEPGYGITVDITRTPGEITGIILHSIRNKQT